MESQSQKRTPIEYLAMIMVWATYGIMLGAAFVLAIGLFFYCMFGGWIFDY